MRMPANLKTLALPLFVWLAFFAVDAHAAIDNAGVFDSVLDRYQAAASGWSNWLSSRRLARSHNSRVARSRSTSSHRQSRSRIAWRAECGPRQRRCGAPFQPPAAIRCLREGCWRGSTGWTGVLGSRCSGCSRPEITQSEGCFHPLLVKRFVGLLQVVALPRRPFSRLQTARRSCL